MSFFFATQLKIHIASMFDFLFFCIFVEVWFLAGNVTADVRQLPPFPRHILTGLRHNISECCSSARCCWFSRHFNIFKIKNTVLPGLFLQYVANSRCLFVYNEGSGGQDHYTVIGVADSIFMLIGSYIFTRYLMGSGYIRVLTISQVPRLLIMHLTIYYHYYNQNPV